MRIPRPIALLLAAAISFLPVACGGGAGSTGTTLPASPSGGPGIAPEAAFAVRYAPAVTVYPEKYSGIQMPTIPFGPLAVNPTGTTFYFFDENYRTVELNRGTWSAFVTRTYDDGGTTIDSDRNGNDVWAYDSSGRLYTIGTSAPPNGEVFLVSRAVSTLNNTFTELFGNTNGDEFDLEASRIPNRILVATDRGLQVVDGANSTGATVHTIALPGGNCGFRAIEGTNHTMDVSVCMVFNQIVRYSSNFQALASATVANASHLNEIAPDPDGGVWFVDGVGNHFGKMSASGKVHEFPVPAGYKVSAVATALDGSVWISLGKPRRLLGFLGHVSETGTVTIYPLPSPLGNAEYLRGTFGAPAGTPNRLYFLDQGGSIGVIDLNPT